jgi:hypothetical protein
MCEAYAKSDNAVWNEIEGSLIETDFGRGMFRGLGEGRRFGILTCPLLRIRGIFMLDLFARRRMQSRETLRHSL